MASSIKYTQICNYLYTQTEIDQQIGYLPTKPCRDKATHFVHEDDIYKGLMSNVGIGMNKVSKCGYKPLGSGKNGAVYDTSNGMCAITLCESINVPNYTIKDGEVIYDGKLADTPTKNYAKSGGRNLKYRVPPYLYFKSSNVVKVDENSIYRSMLYIGKYLYRVIALLGWYKTNYLYPVCRDLNTGAESIENGRPYNNSYMTRQIVYGNWYQDYMPNVIKYADHVTVCRPKLDKTAAYMSKQTGGFLAHPLYSYFRSDAILWTNTPRPSNVTEADAENDNGNLVFDFNVSDKNKDKWVKLIETETLSNVQSIIYSSGTRGDQFGGSRSTLYYKVTKNGLYIGATGEVGNRYEDECQMDGNSNPYLSLWSNQHLTLEMVHDCNDRQVPGDGPYAGASFAGHGIRIKARVKSID